MKYLHVVFLLSFSSQITLQDITRTTQSLCIFSSTEEHNTYVFTSSSFTEQKKEILHQHILQSNRRKKKTTYNFFIYTIDFFFKVK